MSVARITNPTNTPNDVTVMIAHLAHVAEGHRQPGSCFGLVGMGKLTGILAAAGRAVNAIGRACLFVAIGHAWIPVVRRADAHET
jgi:hypothetical protein